MAYSRMLSFHLIALIIGVHARPMQGSQEHSSTLYDWYDPNDSLWAETHTYDPSSEAPSDPSTSYDQYDHTLSHTEEIHTGSIDSSLSIANDSPPYIVTPSDIQEWIQFREVSKLRLSRTCLDREYRHARIQMNLPEMTTAQWHQLLDQGDAKAIQISKDYEKKILKERRFYALKKRIRRSPHDSDLLAQLQQFNLTAEEYLKRRQYKKNKLPLSKPIRDRLNTLIRKVRIDVEKVNSNKPLNPIRSSQAVKLDESKCQNPKHAAGNVNANRINEKLYEMRENLRAPILDVASWKRNWMEVNDWMKTNQKDYIPIEQPFELKDWHNGFNDDEVSTLSNSEDQNGFREYQEGDWNVLHPADQSYQATNHLDANPFDLGRLSMLLGFDQEE